MRQRVILKVRVALKLTFFFVVGNSEPTATRKLQMENLSDLLFNKHVINIHILIKCLT